MIMSFGNAAAQSAWERRFRKGVPNDILKLANRKLMQINSAKSLDDLRVPPGNRLELLLGKRAGQHSVRINDQWRLCFVWRDGNAFEVELVDYH
ncbi:type II toxin-antitoxin system RelE/ParE family toxin [Devosia subaequoris]|nr:type II toxin-antitoxin system RelE/ParE family toxin [Devosia subaequoris]MCP1208190.1 type II toxin-antitoxin system RelE/ParE family toxin [Devosia subaequoris]